MLASAYCICAKGTCTRPSPLHFSSLASPLGLAYALDGRIDEALPLLERAVEQATAIQLMHTLSLRVAMLSEAYLLAGRLEVASDLARRASQRLLPPGPRPG